MATRAVRSATHGVLGLPEWIADPLVPTHRDGAPDLVSAAEAQLATARSGHG